MTREDAIAEIKYYMEHDSYADAPSNEACQMAINALRPVSREKVEKVWRGEWIVGEPDVLGVPIHCSRCGWGSDHADQRKWMEYNGHLFCGYCGAPMTDEAVKMVIARLEAQKDGKGV